MALKLVSSSKCFGGEQRVYSHFSDVVDCEMKFGVYLPPSAIDTNTAHPVLYYLSGITCTHEYFIQKTGFQRLAAKHGFIVINPDTIPRGIDYANINDRNNAGFYVDATEAPWNKNYKMYTYVTRELVDLVNSNLPVLPNKCGIFGHSMGGHGALLCALKNPGLYRSVSAMAPISNPTKSIRGREILAIYFGPNEDTWKAWDATEVAVTYAGPKLDILLDHGSEDVHFLQKTLLPQNFINATSTNDNINLTYNLHKGYDHGSHYVSTFIEDHFEHHAKFLNA